MGLLITMLPLYLIGNLHCIGMCGPLALMLGRHRFRYYYFLGRIASFTLAGMIAGEAGAVLHQVLQQYNIPALTCFLFGGMMVGAGIFSLLRLKLPGGLWFAKLVAPINHSLASLMLRDQPWATFLFGFFTVFLPCGQTILVFSACALSGDLLTGLINGFFFALLTSPSLFLAMHAHSLLSKMKKYYNTVLGACAIVVGSLALCRGFAEVEMISHWIINPNAPAEYHIVLY